MTIEELLQKEGKYVGPVKGYSMLPLLVEERDSVVICAQKPPYKILDVVLYKRGEDYILHRIVDINNNEYIIRGDNCFYDERVKEEHILGVLKEFFQGEKHVFCDEKEYLRYSKRHVRFYPFRKFAYKIKNVFKKLLRAPYRIILKQKNKG